MASLTIRNLDPPLKTLLRVRAARNGQSMEQEARNILRAALGSEPEDFHVVDRILHRVSIAGGVDLDIPSRELDRNPPDFGR